MLLLLLLLLLRPWLRLPLLLLLRPLLLPLLPLLLLLPPLLLLFFGLFLQQTPPLKDIAAAIKVSGISKIDLSMEEVKLIVSTLVYDGLLEEVRGAASRFNRNVGGRTMFHLLIIIQPSRDVIP